MRLLVLLAFLACPAFAQVTTVASSNPKDEIARLQVDHLKEMVILLEKKNDQIRQADISANEQRFKAQEQAVAFALASSEKATIKADTATEKRFDGVNEFRNQLKDQASTFITRAEIWGWVVAVLMLTLAVYNAFKQKFPRGTK